MKARIKLWHEIETTLVKKGTESGWYEHRETKTIFAPQMERYCGEVIEVYPEAPPSEFDYVSHNFGWHADWLEILEGNESKNKGGKDA